MQATSNTVQQTPASQNSTLTQEHNMAFINETLTVQDKAWFASFNFQSVFTRDLVPLPRKWTIDRERDAVLIKHNRGQTTVFGSL